MLWFEKGQRKGQRKAQRATGLRPPGRRLNLESLESRSVLSGFSMSSMAHVHSGEHEHTAAAAIHSHAATTAIASPPVFRPIQSSTAVQPTAAQANVQWNATLVSTVNGSTASGKASFESEREHGKTQQSFSVSVQGAAPSTTLDVLINAVKVGQISTNPSGNGRLVFSSNSHGSASAFPANFPTIGANDSISVGMSLSGAFAAGTSGSENDGGGGDSGESGESEVTETKLSASLSDPTGGITATGSASFNSEQDDGSATTSFRASVKGAAPNATLNVAIDGAIVGAITVDANGNGSLYLSSNTKNSKASPLPPNFPAVNDGSTVTIGDALTGQLGTTQKTSRRVHDKSH